MGACATRGQTITDHAIIQSCNSAIPPFRRPALSPLAAGEDRPAGIPAQAGALIPAARGEYLTALRGAVAQLVRASDS